MSCSYVASTVCALARHVLRAVAHVGLQGACQGTGQSKGGLFRWPEARASAGSIDSKSRLHMGNAGCSLPPAPPRVFNTRRLSPTCSQSQQQRSEDVPVS